MIKKLPLPVTAVALGFGALGNLLESYSPEVRLFCGAVALVLLLAFAAKTILYPETFREDMKNPIMASVFCTFSMAVILLAGYAKMFLGSGAAVIWYLGIVLHILLMLYFTKTFMLKPAMPKVFASYFIVYVGIAVSSVTAPAFNGQALGRAAFWFAFVMFLVLLVFISRRYVTVPEVPAPARPLFCIYAAPCGLCLAGYMQSFPEKSLALSGFLGILCLCLYLATLMKLPEYLKLPFYPSYAAFTFPFVISAIGMKQLMAYLNGAGHPVPGMNLLVLLQTVVAAVLVVYTLLRYVMFLFEGAGQTKGARQQA